MLISIKNYSIYNMYSLFKILYQYEMVIVNTLYLFVAGKRYIGLMLLHRLQNGKCTNEFILFIVNILFT